MKKPPEKEKPAVGAAGVRNSKTNFPTIEVIPSRVKGVKHVSQVLAELFADLERGVNV